MEKTQNPTLHQIMEKQTSKIHMKGRTSIMTQDCEENMVRFLLDKERMRGSTYKCTVQIYQRI